MKGMINKILVAAAGVCLLSACTLHEAPKRTAEGELGVDPTQVMLDITITANVELPGTDESTIVLPDTVQHRFVVEAYNSDREVVNRQVFYDTDLSATKFTIPVTMRLHARKYRIVVWSDYVRISDPDAQLYYDAATLAPVINNGSYRGNAEAKDAFTGYADINLMPYADEWNSKVSVDIALSRPVGRYELITTDVEAFKRRIAEGAISGEKFTAVIKYDGFLSVGFNCYDQVRKHSLNYMSYKTTLRIPTDETASLTIGFDYLLVAPDESLNIPVEVEIVNENNETVSRSFVSIPVTVDANVKVSGRFLTSTADGGMNIDPGYDGSTTIDVGTLTPTR